MTDVTRFICSLYDMALRKCTAEEVLRIKWCAEALADRARRELQARDARAVDEACALRTGETA